MPNIRKKGKKSLNAWIPEADRDRLDELAEAEGITVTDIITRLVKEEIARAKKNASEGDNK